MISNQKYRINTLAKDLNIKSKDILDLLAENGFPGKTHMAVLEPEEFNLIIDRLTAANQVTNIDQYLNGEVKLNLPKPKPAPEKAATPDSEKTVQPLAARPSTTQSPAAQSPAVQPSAAQNPTAQQAQRPAQTAQGQTNPAQQQQGRPAASGQGQPRPAGMQGQQRPAQQQQQGRPAASGQGQPRPAAGMQGQQRPAQQQQGRPAASGQGQPRPAGMQGQQRPAQQQGRPAAYGQGQPRPAGGQGQPRPAGMQGQQRPGQQPDPRQHTTMTAQQAAAESAKARSARLEQKFQNKPVLNQPQKAKPQKTPRPGQQTLRPQPETAPASEVNTNVQPERGAHIHGTRVVDTRTHSVDLSKYDERLEKLVPDAAKNAAGEKQKLKKQNTRVYDREREKERLAMERNRKLELEKARKAQLVVSIPDEIAVGELASRLKATAADVIKRLMLMGFKASINQTVDFDTAFLVADEMGIKVNREVVVTIEDKLFDEKAEDNDETLVGRAPVVVVMGHVDHGKTSLLDAIRHTSVTRGEAGGITQHIGAYRVSSNGRDLTFLDTPGHEAFTAMRARGAKATDIAILVVAADDGIMPQTIEAINHAKAAGVDIIVAINKMDKYGADPDTIKQNLTKYDLVPEEWGGDIICVPVSALTGMGIETLLENVLLVADMKELKANPNRRAKGIVIEAKLDRGRGPVATILIQNGTLKSGDVVIAGTVVGRIRAMTDDRGEQLREAGPSVPVEIIGLDGVPAVGDEFNAVEDERMARELAGQRREKQKDETFKNVAKVGLENMFEQNVTELKIVVKADVGGSAEAVKSSLEKLSNDEVKVKVIHSGVGGITENDVMFASASEAIIVGFNVRPDKSALDSAERNKVDVRTYRVIYECIEEITAAMKGMLEPVFREVIIGHVQVRQVIRVPNVGAIAGSYVQDGKITRNSQIRILRDGVVISEDKISSLRRFKDDVKEVMQGFECGIGLNSFNDIKENDIYEVYEREQVQQ